MAGKKLNGIRVAVLAADGVEQIELTSPVKHLEKHGAQIEVISLHPGKIKGMNLLLPGKNIKVNRTIFRANPDNYDALLIPGGHINPDFLRQSDSVLQFVREFDAANKPIAVICHGPWVLVSAGVVKNRTLTSWPGIKDDVINAGGNWVNNAAVRDGNWISSRSPLDLIQFNREMISLFAEHKASIKTSRRGRLLPTLGWLTAGAAVAAAIYGSNVFESREGVEMEEEEEPVGTPVI
ncbi:type 1 glutamine amidotransferase domain-containing protein [Pedosphaera parvula]|uniref:Intracellular protease, PfpI family n=1 Tax=Pedosphaera parvula (strain Ellin514) TaxID=320771 RepID=B9XL12_PEDPL|nr:type 1 glutamine amidotransferase domain-containing protein [Pedosphaera parvula]EEF59506.1 intracellular protease, PfpI family [Pedosphaera parvula Ellin514]